MIAAETMDGFSFTPRYLNRPMIWQPAQELDGRIPRDQVDQAMDSLFERFDVVRAYCDPPKYETDIDNWAIRHGEDRVIEWPTYRTKPMHEALERFVVDLTERRIRHDGCPLTQLAMNNARRLGRMTDRYVLSKPSQAQKIDPAMARVLAHEAAADARTAGWSDKPAGPTYFRLPR